MKPPPFNLYYAEEVFNEPWQPITKAQVHLRFRRLVIAAGIVVFVATFCTGVMLDRYVHAGAARPINTVLIAAAQTDLVASPVIASAAAPAPVRPAAIASAASARTPVPLRPVAKVVAKSDAALSSVSSSPRQPKTVVNGHAEETPKLPQVQIGNKVVESAPGSRFAIARITSTEVQLVNGVRVKVGGRFPNGEEVVALDPVRMRVETSTRVMVVLPESDDTKR